jgi:hypothetical protein
LRSAAVVVGVLGGLAQLGVAFMGDAIVGLVGAAVVFRWTVLGAVLMAIAGLGAVIALSFSTLIEIPVAALLLGAVAATCVSSRTTQLRT